MTAVLSLANSNVEDIFLVTNQCRSLTRVRSGVGVSLGCASLLGVSVADACTRVLYSGSDNMVITGRSMDWRQDNSPRVWVMPRSMEHHGATGPSSIRWTSKYGRLVVSMYDIATVDGINEKGLVANILYLADSDYGRSQGKPTLSIGG